MILELFETQLQNLNNSDYLGNVDFRQFHRREDRHEILYYKVWRKTTNIDNFNKIIISKDGFHIRFYLGSNLHRLDGPAWISEDREIWYHNGRRAQITGPNEIRFNPYTQLWYRGSMLHRENGPARISAESQEWYNAGRLHRFDGPARIFNDGRAEYWIYNKPYSKTQFKRLKKFWNKG